MYEEIIKEFREKFVNQRANKKGVCRFMSNKTGLDGWLYWITPKKVEQFLLKKLAQREKEMSGKIGLLRQWLNEERITDPEKMVSNGEIKVFLTEPLK